MPIPGTKRLDRLTENLGAAQLALSAETVRRIGQGKCRDSDRRPALACACSGHVGAMSHQTWTRDQILVTVSARDQPVPCGPVRRGHRALPGRGGRKGVGFSNGAYAAIITVSSLATAIASLVLGPLSDRIGDRRKLVILSAVMGGVAYALIFLAPGSTYCGLLRDPPLWRGAFLTDLRLFARLLRPQRTRPGGHDDVGPAHDVFGSLGGGAPVAGWIASPPTPLTSLLLQRPAIWAAR